MCFQGLDLTLPATSVQFVLICIVLLLREKHSVRLVFKAYRPNWSMPLDLEAFKKNSLSLAIWNIVIIRDQGRIGSKV